MTLAAIKSILDGEHLDEIGSAQVVGRLLTIEGGPWCSNRTTPAQELVAARIAVATVTPTQYRRQRWRLAGKVRTGTIDRVTAVDTRYEIAIAHALVRAPGEVGLRRSLLIPAQSLRAREAEWELGTFATAQQPADAALKSA